MVAAGEAPPRWLALLEDRVLMGQGKKQVYGTQVTFHQTTGKPELYPVENEPEVDSRRARVGLPPFREYLSEFGIDYVPAR